MKLQAKSCLCAMIVVTLLLTPLYAYARGPKRDFLGDKAWEEGKRNQRQNIYQQLDLSPEQAGQLKTLRNTYREQRQQYRDNIQAKKEELRKELQKQDLDMGKIDQLHSELKTMLNQREDNRLKEILEVREILTSEQLGRFLEWREKFPRKSKVKHRIRK